MFKHRKKAPSGTPPAGPFVCGFRIHHGSLTGWPARAGNRWLASLTRTRTFASLSLSDPLPGLIEIPLTVLRVLARKLGNRG